MKTTEADLKHMRAALSLAKRGLGRVWPNPAVGCVLVDARGSIIARGWTGSGGRPHAETIALLQAGEAARGATAYVTLEPCSHQGKTPPCADALIRAGIARCVIAIEDPDPRVSGAGIAQLRAAGIDVAVGALRADALDVALGHFCRQAKGRPMVALKLATSLDGKIAAKGGQSRWITGQPARDFGHRLRATHDAVMVGSGTILADDPQLTCRQAGLEDRSPVRIVLDRRGRISAEAKVLADQALAPTWIITSEVGATVLAKNLKKVTQLIVIKENNEKIKWLESCLLRLGELGLTRILVEGGAEIATSLLADNLIDRFYWFRSGQVLGNDGKAGIGNLDLQELSKAWRFNRRELRLFGDDVLEVLDITA